MKLDLSSPQSIEEFANQLMGSSISEFIDETLEPNIQNKGDLGNLVEEYLYRIKPDNTNGLPDFTEAGVELKTTGVKRLRDGKLKPKERLVLTKINYHKIVLEDWESSSLLRKCALLLILFYLYEENTPVIERIFIAKKLWQIPEHDLPRIKADWEIIVDKIRQGKAHELSEGDTWYLGACTKSSSSSVTTTQPNSDIVAKPRAFSFKVRYLNTILSDTLGKDFLIPSNELANIEKILEKRASRFSEKTIQEIEKELGGGINLKAKGAKASLSIRILGYKRRKIPELEKANIQVKIVTINQSGKSAKESISFPAFNYMDFLRHTWETSDFHDYVEKRFLFVVFKVQNSKTVFKGIKFWTMPYEDRKEAERIWNLTKELVISGDYENLPSIKQTSVAHVRPHGRDSKDLQLAPDGNYHKKKSFWLNAKYVCSQVKDVY